MPGVYDHRSGRGHHQLWPNRLDKPAFGTVELDRTHPLARGLSVAYLFNAKAGLIERDLTGVSHGAYSSGDWGAHGKLFAAGTSPQLNASYVPAQPSLTEHTQVFIARPASVTNDQYLSHSLQGGTANVRSVILGFQDGYWNVFHLSAYPTGNPADTQIAADAGQTQMVGFASDGTTIWGWKNGTRQYAVAGNLTLGPFQITDLDLGHAAGGSYFAGELIAYYRWESRALTDGDVQQLWGDPYAMFEPIKRRSAVYISRPEAPLPDVVGGARHALWPDRSQKPTSQVQASIDRTNDLTRGLCGAFLFNDITLTDLVNVRAIPIVRNGAPTLVPSASGPAMAYGAGDWHTLGSAFELGVGDVSFFAIARLTFGGAFNRVVFASNGIGTATPRLAFLVDTTGHLGWLLPGVISSQTAGTIVNGMWYAVAVSYDRADVRIQCAEWPSRTLVLDETLASDVPASGSGSHFTIGDYFDSQPALAMQGDLLTMYFWAGRLLSTDDFRSLVDAPYQLFESRKHQRPARMLVPSTYVASNRGSLWNGDPTTKPPFGSAKVKS